MAFEDIYEAALRADEVSLDQAVPSGGVDALASQGFPLPAVAVLAKEGKIEAVDFLVKQGDADDKFAILGYAQGGHFQNAQELLNDGERNRKTSAIYYALGAHLGKHKEEFDKFVAQEAVSKEDIIALAKELRKRREKQSNESSRNSLLGYRLRIMSSLGLNVEDVFEKKNESSLSL